MILFFRTAIGWFSLGLLFQLFFYSPEAMGEEEVLFRLDFSQVGQREKSWLEEQGFILQKGMKNDGDIELSAFKGSKGLVLSAKKPSFGFAFLKGLEVKEAGQLEIEWGVLQYPLSASWQNGINREAIMVQIFFGEKVEADEFYLPASPYFIGLFLGKNDPLKAVFTGKSYMKTGRYLCLGNPEPGEMLTSRVDIDTLFKQLFEVDMVPPVTGLGIEVDTSGIADGRSSAVIKKITIFKKSVEGQ